MTKQSGPKAAEGGGVLSFQRLDVYYVVLGTTTVVFQFADQQSQSIVVLFDESGRRMSVVYSTSNAVDISFVKQSGSAR